MNMHLQTADTTAQRARDQLARMAGNVGVELCGHPRGTKVGRVEVMFSPGNAIKNGSVTLDGEIIILPTSELTGRWQVCQPGGGQLYAQTDGELVQIVPDAYKAVMRQLMRA